MAATRPAEIDVREDDSLPKAKKRKEEGKKKVFRWTDEMHASLIEFLAGYKVRCEYNNVDFDADKTAQYKALRVEMAKRYNEATNDELPFGPVDVSPKKSEDLSKEESKKYHAIWKNEQKQISTGYNRVQEKVKLLRQGFSKALIAGTRSGSGKLVYEHYDTLKKIWGGSPNTNPLPTGIHSSEINEDSSFSEFGESDQNSSNYLQEEDIRGSRLDVSTESTPDVNSHKDVSNTGASTSAVPKLIDNKRKHLERRLSAAQRDALLLEENKDEKLFRKQLTETLKESTQSMAKALSSISQSMMHVGNAIAQNMQMMAQSMAVPQNSHPLNHQRFWEVIHHRGHVQNVSQEHHESYLDFLNEHNKQY